MNSSGRYSEINRSGLSHSDIPGSKPACGSPGLIATYYVLLRLLAPRHSPHALSSLITKLNLNHPSPCGEELSRQTQRIIVICPKIYLCVVVKEHHQNLHSRAFRPRTFDPDKSVYTSTPPLLEWWA